MYNAVIVDDDRLIIRGLSSVVPWQKLGCRVVGTAVDGGEGIRLIRECRPDHPADGYPDAQYGRADHGRGGAQRVSPDADGGADRLPGF